MRRRSLHGDDRSPRPKGIMGGYQSACRSSISLLCRQAPLSPARSRTADAGDNQHMSQDYDEAALRDAAHDAFLAFWRGVESDEAEMLWRAYCAAQERYEACLRVRER